MDDRPEDLLTSFSIRGKPFHPEIARRSIPLYSTGHYEEAVSNSFKVIEARLREATSSQEVGIDLVNLAFNPNSGLLVDPNAWPAEREGVHLLFRGAFLAFRNPSGHRFVDLDKEQAFDLMVLANRLLLIIEAVEQRIRSQGVTRPVLLPVQQQGHLWGTAPALIDADNDGQDEVVVPTPGIPAPPFAPEGFMTNADRPIAIYDQSPTGLVEATVEPINARYGWSPSDLGLADVDGDGLNEVYCILSAFGTIGEFLLLYKYRGGRYEVLKGTSQGTPGFNEHPDPYVIFNNSFLNDFDGDGVQEVVSIPKIGFGPPGLIPSDQAFTGFEQLRIIWKWDPVLALLRIVRWDVETLVDAVDKNCSWLRLGP
jgi:uncharacterized protein (TIGR02391 family)